MPDAGTLWRGMIVTPIVFTPLAFNRRAMLVETVDDAGGSGASPDVVRPHEDDRVADTVMGEDVAVHPI